MTTNAPAHPAATRPSTETEDEAPAPRPLWTPIAWCILAGSLLPLGANAGLPFQVSPADVLLPLAIPLVVFALPRPKTFGLYMFLTLTTLAVILGWGIVTGDEGISEIQSWLFFWKSWIACFLAYGLIMSSRDPRRAVDRVLGLVSLGLIVLTAMAALGWFLEGQLVSGTQNNTGGGVTGFTAGSWAYPVKLYGYGQVNVTATLMALAAPVFAYRAMRTRAIFVRLLWLACIPVPVWLVINSGSRGAVVTVGLFFALLFLAARRSVSAISLPKLFVTLALSLLVISQAQAILDASPKYSRTITQLSEGETGAVTSGRDQINALSLDDIARSPIVGSAFGDFERFHTFADTPWVNSSPHNTYLGAVQKMGIPLGLGYFILMLRTLPRERPRGFPGTELLCLTFTIPVAIGAFPVGDALTTPVLAATILTVSGALMAILEIEKRDAEADEEPGS